MISNFITLNKNINNINTTKKTVVKNNCGSGYNLNPLKKDVFVRSILPISFKGKKGPCQETLDYIKQAREDYLKKNGRELDKVYNLDLNKISDICKDISVFKDWSARDLALLTKNIESILIQRGCSHQCIHCGLCSSHKISTMHWIIIWIL